jgi:AcrR family transcriptional regulator
MPELSRRERIRAETLREIREIGARQVDEGGLAALSLNAIAKEMGMSGPALYRYYASRDELLAALIVDGYADLTRAVEGAERELAAVARAYREWALAHPRRYGLLFGERPEGFRDPEEAIAAIQGAMNVVVGILAARDAPPAPDALAPALEDWAGRREGLEGVPAGVLRQGVRFWTRVHGIVSLELAGVLADMGLDAGALIADEVASL